MSLITQVRRLIGGVGETVILRRSAVTGGEPWAPETTLTDFPVTAVLRRYRPQELAGLVRGAEQEARIAAEELPVTPDPETDSLVVGGRTRAILAVETRSLAGRPALHRLSLGA